MENHNRLLSIFHIIYGTIHILLFFIILLLLNTFLPYLLDVITTGNQQIASIIEASVGWIKLLIFFFIVILPLPSVIGGIALLMQKQWGLIMMMISGCFSILNFPIGSALGVYTIWVFVEKNKSK